MVINFLLDAQSLAMTLVETGKELPRGRHGSIQRMLPSSKSSALATSRLASLDQFKTISSSKSWNC